jgi:ribosomal protein S24E
LNLTITSTETNPLFKRREVEFRVEEPSTPSRSSVRIELAVALRVEMNQVYVREMKTRSGTRTTLGVAHVYEDSDTALKVEPKHIIERNMSAAAPEPETEPEPVPQPEPGPKEKEQEGLEEGEKEE